MNSNQVIKKRNFILISFVLVTAIFITAITLVFVKVKDYNIMTLVNIVLVFTLSLISLAFRSTLYSYNNMVRIANLVLKQAKPVNYTQNIILDQSLISPKEYTVFTKNDNYVIYYKHELDETIRVKKIWRLYIIMILKKESLDFYDKGLHDEIAKLEVSFPKKELPTKYIIIGFKEFGTSNDQVIKDIGEVVSYAQNRQTYTQVNVGLIRDSHKAYFLYSDHYYPTRYYQIAVDLIFNLIGAKRVKIETKKKSKSNQ